MPDIIFTSQASKPRPDRLSDLLKAHGKWHVWGFSGPGQDQRCTHAIKSFKVKNKKKKTKPKNPPAPQLAAPRVASWTLSCLVLVVTSVSTHASPRTPQNQLLKVRNLVKTKSSKTVVQQHVEQRTVTADCSLFSVCVVYMIFCIGVTHFWPRHGASFSSLAPSF